MQRKDIYIAAYNPVRDTVFAGNPETYETARTVSGYVSMFTGNYSIIKGNNPLVSTKNLIAGAVFDTSCDIFVSNAVNTGAEKTIDFLSSTMGLNISEIQKVEIMGLFQLGGEGINAGRKYKKYVDNVKIKSVAAGEITNHGQIAQINSAVGDGNVIKVMNDTGKAVGIGGSKVNKIGYEYLNDQLGGLKDKVKINQYQSAENVNDWWESRGYKSPYKKKSIVQNITLTEDTKFVRVYDGVNSNLEGGWVMRAEDIKGLTAKEIQVKYALEYEPSFIGEVELKAGDTIRLGEVGPNFGFDGGGIQIDLQQQWIGDFTELGKIEDWRWENE